MDYAPALFFAALFLLAFGFKYRARLRAWWVRSKLKTRIATGNVEPAALSERLYELNKVFEPFGSNAAHPSALYAQRQFIEAADLLASANVSLAVVMQYVEGNSWSLAAAALAALRKRQDRAQAVQRVLAQCEYFSPWTMYFALQLISEAEPRPPVGAPLIRAKDWWVDNRWMPNIFRDYLAGCEERKESATFGDTLNAHGAASHDLIRRFLQRVSHAFAQNLIGEIDEQARSEPEPYHESPQRDSTLRAVGRYWRDQDPGILVEPAGWHKALKSAEAALQRYRARSLLVCGEPLVGKTSFLRLLAERMGGDGWSVFEASGADLQADQVYIGQLEGRIRQVVDELARGYRLIWYIPDIVQLAMSGRHQGQSATMLDQIVPAIAAGRLVIWCEATPKSTARLMQIRPSLRSLFEIVTIEPLPPEQTATLARQVVKEMAERSDVCFEDECAEVALDSAGQYLGTAGLPGSALLILKLAAARIESPETAISPRRVLETFSQLSGLPLAILDTREQLDLKAVRQFFSARVIGQEEAVEAMVERIAMLKSGLNDPGKPIGVFLFAGPTGTGKTELAKAVAEYLFGSIERMIRLDMSEFQTFDSMTKILGQNTATAFEPDSLISRVRKQPFSVILLDEFEKAHPNIWDLFLQAFDEGRLTDAMGDTADLRHCLIIMTSNLGATSHRTLGLGFAPQADEFTKDQVLRAIAQTYRPEFQNRLDKVIVFRPLTRDLMRGILKKELAGLLDRRGLKDRAWAIEWESSALEFLLEKGFSPEMGARPLKRAIDQYLVAPLAAIIVEKRFPEGEQFLFVRSNGKAIQVEFVDPDADVAAGAEAPAATPAAQPGGAGALAAMVLAPKGTRAEFQQLQAEYAAIEEKLATAEWNELKDGLAGEMAEPDFWNREDRFGTLARFALMDRVKSAAETANALRRRLERYARAAPRYSAELSGRLALQLFLIREGIADALENAPVELALLLEPVFDGGADRQATLAWCGRLTAMYRAWSAKRHAQWSEVVGATKEKNLPILLISGFGVYRTLRAEAGLHVLEASEAKPGRVTARVRLSAVPLGDVPAAKERRLVLQALDEAARPNTVVRRYREEPPLVRDAAGKWRTGRFDLVLGGDFDLLQAGET